MIELEIILQTDSWPISWLLSPVEVISQEALFTGVITAENYEFINPHSLRAVFTIESTLPALPTETPATLTAPLEAYPDISHLSPSENTYWPIDTNNNPELLISFINNNSNNPIAQGSLYHKLNTDPVTDQNPTEHILKTINNNQFMISDAVNQLSFIYQQNKILLDIAFKILTPLGNIILDSHKNINYFIRHNLTENTEKNYSQTTQNNYTLTTAQNNIFYQTSYAINTTSKHSIIFNTRNILQINTAVLSSLSEKKLTLSANKNIILESLGKLSMEVLDNIIITSEENLNIIINPGTSITLSKSGVININSPQITVSGQPILSVMPVGPG